MTTTDFTHYFRSLIAALGQQPGWYGVFAGREPGAAHAYETGAEVPPWDVVRAVLHDLAAAHGTVPDPAELAHARALYVSAVAEWDAAPGAAHALQQRLEAVGRAHELALIREREAARALDHAATTPASAASARLTAVHAWARDDRERAAARHEELRSRLAALSGYPPRSLAEPGTGTAPALGHWTQGGPAATHAGSAPADERFAGQGPPTGGHFGAAPGSRQPQDGRYGGTPDPVRAHDGRFGGAEAELGQARDGGYGGAPGPVRTEEGLFRDAPGPGQGRDERFGGAPASGQRQAPGRAQTQPHPQAQAQAHAQAPRPAWAADPSGVPGSAGPDGGEPQPEAPAARKRPARRNPRGARFAGAPEEEPGGPAQAPAGARFADVPQAAPPRAGRAPRGARFAGAPEAVTTGPEPVPDGGGAPLVPGPGPAAGSGGSPRGARFAGAPAAADQPWPRPTDPRWTAEARAAASRLAKLRAAGETGAAYVALCEAAVGPAERLPYLVRELEHAGLGADVATLLWETAALPPGALAAAAAALAAEGRTGECRTLLHQAAARPPADLATTATLLTEAARTDEAAELLETLARTRPLEDAVAVARARPALTSPLLDAAARISQSRRLDVSAALRRGGLPGA